MSDFPIKDELEFNRFLISEYLKYGSVDKVYRIHKDSLPISPAQYYRVLDDWGVVKAVGPDSKFVEAVEFMSHLAKESVPIESLYKRIPSSFQTSVKTLYRVLSYVKEGLTRRVGVALIITPYNNKEKVLLAQDVSTPRLEFGKNYGSISLPMGYARKRDLPRINIKRILQQEVFMTKVIKRDFPSEIIPDNPHPFLYLDIADVRISVYNISLPRELSAKRNFSSYKLRNYEFKNINKIIKNDRDECRVGVKEAVLGYKKYLDLLSRNLSVNPFQVKSFLNHKLANLAEVEVEIVKVK